MKLSMLFLVLLFSGVYGCAKEQAMTNQLSGDFDLVSSEHCIYSSAFGPAPVLQPIGPTYLESKTTQGILKLDRSGTGTIEGRSAALISLPAGQGVQQAAVRCSVTYQKTGRHGEFQMEQKCAATPLRGPWSTAAQTVTFSPLQIEGRWHGSTLLAADTQLAIETVTSFSGANNPRLCHRMWSATRISPSP